MTATPADTLPTSARVIVDAVGWDAALALIARFGGTTIHLPTSAPGPDHALAWALGLDVARLLCASLGPGPLAVPRAMSWVVAQRSREVVARRQAGETEAEVARRFGLTERHVRRIYAAARQHLEHA